MCEPVRCPYNSYCPDSDLCFDFKYYYNVKYCIYCNRQLRSKKPYTISFL